MLILYDINHNKIAPLIKHRDLRIERDLSGQEVLFFSYPHKNADDIKEECYVRTKAQEFVVKEISDRGDWSQVVGKVNLEDIKGKSVENFETINATITNAINLALVGTGWTLAYTDITKLRTVRKANCGAFDVLEEIRKVYRAEFKFDAISKTISAYASMGKDKGTYFTDELNLRNLAVQSNSYDFCTRLIPIGKDGLKITDVNGGIEYVENHQYSNKVITRIWEDNRYTDAQSLREDAISKLDELSKPVKAYSAGIIDLARANDKYADILNYDLGDTITLVSREKRIKEKQRIVKIVEYPDEPERNACEIANRTLRLEDMQTDALDAADTVDSITTSDGMVDDSKVNLDPIRQEFGSIVAEKADITDLQAAEGRIGTLEATSATITQLEAFEADIDHLITNKADIGELTAATGRISVLEGDVADIDTILSKQVFVELATAGQIVAGSGIIAEGAIGNAHISNLDVDKLNSGILSTAKFTVQGSGGRLKIADNLLQVFDGISQLFERVALGDLDGDGSVYGLRIRGADGQTTLLDHDGLTDAGFTDGYSKLADDSLDPAKLDIAQVVTRINDGTETIQSSKIYMDNQTLEAAFSTLETTVSDQGETISSHGSSISAMSDEIELKVDSQEFNTYKTINDQNITSINTTLFTQGSSITALQDEIQLKVTQAEIDTSIDAVQGQIDTHETRISTAESEISQNATDITARVTTSTFNTTVNNITGEVDALEGRVGTAELAIDGLDSKIALKADATVVDSLGTRVSSAELAIDGLEGEIELKVDKDGVISSINQTAEAIRISANRIEISGQTTFASGYDPSTKETPTGAQSKVDAFATSLATALGELAYEDVVEQAMLGSTIISGGYIRTELLDVNAILAISGDINHLTSEEIFIGNEAAGIYSNLNLWGGHSRGDWLCLETNEGGGSIFLVDGNTIQVNMPSFNIFADILSVPSGAVSAQRFEGVFGQRDVLALGTTGCSIDTTGGDARWRRTAGHYMSITTSDTFDFFYPSVGWRQRFSSNGNIHLEGDLVFGSNSYVTLPNNGWIRFAQVDGTEVLAVRAEVGADNRKTIRLMGLEDYTTTNSANLHISGGYQVIRSTSAKKYKREIEPIDLHYAENFFNNCEPVWYRSKCPADRTDWSWYGYIADDVAKIEPRLAMYGEQGQVEGMAYDRVTALLHLIIRENRRKIEALEKEIFKLREAI